MGPEPSYKILQLRSSVHRDHHWIEPFFGLRFPAGMCERVRGLRRPWSRIHVSHTRVVELLCSVMTARQAREPSRRILASSARWFPPLDATLLSPALKVRRGLRRRYTVTPRARYSQVVSSLWMYSRFFPIRVLGAGIGTPVRALYLPFLGRAFRAAYTARQSMRLRAPVVRSSHRSRGRRGLTSRRSRSLASKAGLGADRHGRVESPVCASCSLSRTLCSAWSSALETAHHARSQSGCLCHTPDQ